MRKPKYWSLAVIIGFLCLLMITPAAMALEVKQGDMVTVPAGKIEGPLFVAGNSVVIDADVNGDIFAAGQSVVVNGKVDGDLLAGAQSIQVNGEITGNLRSAGNDIAVKGRIGRSATAAGNMIKIWENAVVGKDALLFGNNVEVLGNTGGQVMGAASMVRINGTVGSLVHLWDVQTLKVGPAAVINGSLYYSSSQAAQIDPGAKIAGGTSWNQIAQHETPQPHPATRFSWISELTWFAAGLLLWGLILIIFPRLWPKLEEATREMPGPVIGWGVLLLVLVPPVSLLLMITVIGIPIAFILIFAYLMILFMAKIAAGDMLGRYLTRRFQWENRVPIWLAFIIGFLIIILLTKIPVIGLFIKIVIACLGLGAAVMAAYNWRKKPPVQPLDIQPQE